MKRNLTILFLSCAITGALSYTAGNRNPNDFTQPSVDLPEEWPAITAEMPLKGFIDHSGTLHIEFRHADAAVQTQTPDYLIHIHDEETVILTSYPEGDNYLVKFDSIGEAIFNDNL